MPATFRFGDKTVYIVYTLMVDARMKNSVKASPAKKSKPTKEQAREVASVSRASNKRSAKVDLVVEATNPPVPKAVTIERVKLVRDSFTMPHDDFELIASLKSRALEFKRPTKKSELLRAGLQQLAGLDEVHLRAALAALRPLPTGRPKKIR